MTTPPLDLPAERLPALRAKLRTTKVTDNAEVLALLACMEELASENVRLTGIIGEAVHFLSSGHGITVIEGQRQLRAMLEGGEADIYRRALRSAEAAERDLASVTVSRDGWQTRAKAAEKKVAAGIELADKALHSWHSVRPYADNPSWEISSGRGPLAEEMLAVLDGTPDTPTPIVWPHALRPAETFNCVECGGSGQVVERYSFPPSTLDCPRCDGTGTLTPETETTP